MTKSRSPAFTKIISKVAVTLMVASAAAPSVGGAQAQDARVFPQIFGGSPSGVLAPISVYDSPGFKKEISNYEQSGFQPLTNAWGESSYRQVVFVIKNDSLQEPLSAGAFLQKFIADSKALNPEAMKQVYHLSDEQYHALTAGAFAHRFVSALGVYKERVMALYGLSDSDYNRLALIAFGILGVETKFSGSLKYKGKEEFPSVVALGKTLKYFTKEMQEKGLSVSTSIPAIQTQVSAAWETAKAHTTLTSRGGTQIKHVPAKIAEGFSLTRDMLDTPEWSAVATVGFLAESLEQLKTMVRNSQTRGQLLFINQENIYDYIPFIYIGKTEPLRNGSANASREPYVEGIREKLNWILIMERPAY